MSFHDLPPVVESKKFNTKLFDKYSDKSIISNKTILTRYALFGVYERSNYLFKDTADLGNYMVESGAEPMEKTKENRIWSKMKTYLYRSDFGFYIIVIFIAVFFSLFGFKFTLLKQIPRDVFWIYLVLPVSNLARFFTVILGDSSHDDLKHFFTLNVEFDFIYLINLFIIVVLISKSISNYFKANKKIQLEKG